MTLLFNDPASFADESRDGFLEANRNRVRGVPGGVVRSTAAPAGSVSVVIGGGSGHYPAFAGLVGAGLANGSAMGNLFASPAARQIESVTIASGARNGVLLTCGNYAGDVLNFTAAAEALRAQGFDVRTLWVTDDISSAPAAERDKRRGIAGGLVVYKVAGAAAASGASLDDVARVARSANDRTRTLGVAFGGSSLPGGAAALFSVPAGRMEVGMGIHGEPGLSERDIPTANELAKILVDALFDELPDDVLSPNGQRAIVIMNGLGSVKYEELFVVYRRVAALLSAAGVEVVEPEVGEFMTSFDMAGCSLTITWLDDELTELWRAPADTPSFRKGSVTPALLIGDDELETENQTADEVGPATEESREAGHLVARMLAAAGEVVDLHVDELGRMDSIAGDGDHGIGMQRGVTAAASAAKLATDAGAGAGTVLQLAGAAWAAKGGGTSGALWGIFLTAVGTTLGDEGQPTAQSVALGVASGSSQIQLAGGATLGDKTMVDAIVPFAEALAAHAAEGIAVAWSAAADAANIAAAATAGMFPRKGRARPHAGKSVGTPDPGAHSFALIVTAVATVLKEGI